MLETLKEKKYINSNQLRLIAIITMLIDHMALVWIGQNYLGRPTITTEEYNTWLIIYWVMRSIGRMAFPIFCFQLVEGFHHTRNPRRYVTRLAIFAVISEIPFDLMISGQLISFEDQNVIITLLLGVLMMMTIEWIRKTPYAQAEMAVVAVFSLLAWILKTDYEYIGILLIAIFYYCYDRRELGCSMGFLWIAVAQERWRFVPTLALASILMYFYNGKRKPSWIGRVSYAFYPAHMVIIYAISKLILR